MSSDNIWRVGVVFSLTGPTATAEAALLNGTRLAIEKINSAGGIRGKHIVPTVLDPACNPAKYREHVRRLTEDEGVPVIFGGYTSAGRKAMIPVLERTNSLLFYPTFYEGFEYSDHVFYFGSCPNQYTMQIVDYMINKFSPSFYLVGANYVFPRESNRIVRHLLKQRGGKVLGERYLPLDSRPSNLNSIIQDIEAKRPDVVFSVLVGDQVAEFYKAFEQTKIRAEGVPIASIVTTETEIAAMGPSAAAGHYCSSSYFSVIQTPENRRFVADYTARFGADQPVSAEAEAAYNQVMVFSQALNDTNTMETSVLRRVMFGRKWAAPQGEIRVHESNHHTHLWSRIGRVGQDGKIEIVHSSDGNVAPDPYLINHDFRDWTEATVPAVEMK